MAVIRLPANGAPSPSLILHETARRHFWHGVGNLSVKAFFSGEALYDVGCGRHLVDERGYLLLNHDRPYTITVDAPSPVESLCLFFAPGLVESARAGLIESAERLLDDPDPPVSAPLDFFERTYPHDAVLSPALHDLRRGLSHQPDVAWIEERLHDIAGRLLHVHREECRKAAVLPAVRAATREELYRRVHRSRDFMAASLDQPLTLGDLARVACLSPNHFLRTFKQVFRQSPHQYLTGLRVERAKGLLERTDLSVTEICLTVGFESLGAFSWLFRRHTGHSPLAYRRAKK